MLTRDVGIVVTKFDAMRDYLIREGYVEDDVPVFEHVMENDVRGKHVIGQVPLYIAVAADLVTVFPLLIPRHSRGKQLTIEELYQYIRQPKTYDVKNIDFWVL